MWQTSNVLRTKIKQGVYHCDWICHFSYWNKEVPLISHLKRVKLLRNAWNMPNWHFLIKSGSFQASLALLSSKSRKAEKLFKDGATSRNGHLKLWNPPFHRVTCILDPVDRSYISNWHFSREKQGLKTTWLPPGVHLDKTLGNLCPEWLRADFDLNFVKVSKCDRPLMCCALR